MKHLLNVKVHRLLDFSLFYTVLGSILWFLVVELFSQNNRDAAAAIGVMVNWICVIIIGLGFIQLIVSLYYTSLSLDATNNGNREFGMVLYFELMVAARFFDPIIVCE